MDTIKVRLHSAAVVLTSRVQVRAGSYEEGGTLVVTKSLFIIKDPSQADDEVVNLMCSIVFYGDKVPPRQLKGCW